MFLFLPSFCSGNNFVWSLVSATANLASENQVKMVKTATLNCITLFPANLMGPVISPLDKMDRCQLLGRVRARVCVKMVCNEICICRLVEPVGCCAFFGKCVAFRCRRCFFLILFFYLFISLYLAFGEIRKLILIDMIWIEKFHLHIYLYRNQIAFVSISR